MGRRRICCRCGSIDHRSGDCIPTCCSPLSSFLGKVLAIFSLRNLMSPFALADQQTTGPSRFSQGKQRLTDAGDRSVTGSRPQAVRLRRGGSTGAQVLGAGLRASAV